MPSSTAVRTSLHATLSAFDVAGERLLFISRRASRRLQEAPLLLLSFPGFLTTPAYVVSVSLSGSLSALLHSFGKLPHGLRCGGIWLCRLFAEVVQEPLDHVPPRHFDLQLLSAELPLLRFGPYGPVIGDSATEVDRSYCHVVVRVRFSRECGLGAYNNVAYSTSMCLTREYVVDAFEVARAAPCDTVIWVRNSVFTRTEDVHDG